MYGYGCSSITYNDHITDPGNEVDSGNFKHVMKGVKPVKEPESGIEPEKEKPDKIEPEREKSESEKIVSGDEYRRRQLEKKEKKNKEQKERREQHRQHGGRSGGRSGGKSGGKPGTTSSRSRS